MTPYEPGILIGLVDDNDVQLRNGDKIRINGALEGIIVYFDLSYCIKLESGECKRLADFTGRGNVIIKIR